MISIRPYKERDLTQVRALDARVDPYLRKDAAEVEAMFSRAAAAPRPVARWGDAASGPDELEQIEKAFLAFWVAVSGGPGEDIVGMIGVQRFQDEPELGDLEAAARWLARKDVAELAHLRVAEEARKHGIGARLVQTVIDWSREAGFGLLVLNTSTPQFPARRLYQRLGFREAGIAYLDAKYEVVWYEMEL
jgi:GNAT superfamily N-acetyltransferase